MSTFKNLSFFGINYPCLFLSTVLLFQSCKDPYGDGNPDNEPTYEISGHLYLDCSMQPMANKSLELFQEITHGWDNTDYGGTLATTTTDSNGFFKFVFKDLRGGKESIEYASGAGFYKVIEMIPYKTSIDSLIVFNNATTNIQVNLNIINPHSANDTLVINDYRTGQNLSIPGPFNSGTIYTVSNYQLLGMNYGGESKRLSWAFYPNNGTQFDTYFLVNKFCDDTIFVTVDIN